MTATLLVMLPRLIPFAFSESPASIAAAEPAASGFASNEISLLGEAHLWEVHRLAFAFLTLDLDYDGSASITQMRLLQHFKPQTARMRTHGSCPGHGIYAQSGLQPASSEQAAQALCKVIFESFRTACSFLGKG